MSRNGWRREGETSWWVEESRTWSSGWSGLWPRRREGGAAGGVAGALHLQGRGRVDDGGGAGGAETTDEAAAVRLCASDGVENWRWKEPFGLGAASELVRL